MEKKIVALLPQQYSLLDALLCVRYIEFVVPIVDAACPSTIVFDADLSRYPLTMALIAAGRLSRVWSS